MPNAETSFSAVETRDEVSRYGCLGVPKSAEQPSTGGSRVGHGLERGERLRRDDEQGRSGRIQVARGLGEISAVDVGHEAEGEVALAVAAQGFVGHHRVRGRCRRCRC